MTLRILTIVAPYACLCLTFFIGCNPPHHGTQVKANRPTLSDSNKGIPDEKTPNLSSTQVSVQSNAKEIIWAGLSGTPPKYIESGDDKGLGYLENESKEVRKALVRAGFQIHYEYYSQTRLDHELSQNRPICFYPYQWSDPKSHFTAKIDRILSIAQNFSVGNRTILIRKGDEHRFKKFLDSKGNVKLEALSNDSGFRTLIPSQLGLPKEFEKTIHVLEDGTFEIKHQYQGYISTRRLRDNNQLIQMLQGNRFDYILGRFVESEDYKMIQEGRNAFTSLSYETRSIRRVDDPLVTYSSVACSLHPLTLDAMPVINTAIAANRDDSWALAKKRYHQALDPFARFPRYTRTFQYRFASELRNGVPDKWYSLQVKQVPGLRMFAQDKEDTTGYPNSSQPLSIKPRWFAIKPQPQDLWIINETDLLAIQNSLIRRIGKYDYRESPAYSMRLMKSFSESEWALLTSLDIEQGLRSKSGVRVEAGDSFEGLVRSDLIRSQPLRHLKLLARGINGSQIQPALGLLQGVGLKELSLMHAAPDVMSFVLPGIPLGLERLNLSGSSLGSLELTPLVQKMLQLRDLNLNLTQMKSSDYTSVLLSLSPKMEKVLLGWNLRDWTVELAKRFGEKKFPNLQVLDLDNSGLDDRHCALLRVFGSRLQSLNLNSNFMTSQCLSKILSQPLPELKKLELNSTWISTKPGIQLRIPETVEYLDLSLSKLDSERITHINFPNSLKSLRMLESDLDAKTFASILPHLASKMDLLDLEGNRRLGEGLFRLLNQSKLSEVDELCLSDIPIHPDDYRLWIQNSTIKNIHQLRLRDSGLNDTFLKGIAARWGAELIEFNGSENRITSTAVTEFLQQSKHLKRLSLKRIFSLDVGSLPQLLSPELTSLDLSANDLDDSDIETLSIKLPNHLRSLDLSGSSFKARGARALAKKIPYLVELNLEDMVLSDSAWAWIASSLSPTLRDFTFGPGKMSAQTTSQFARNMPSQLGRLVLFGVDLDSAASENFFSSLPNSLLELKMMDDSKLSDEGARALSSAWPKNILSVTFKCKFSRSVFDRLAESLPLILRRLVVKSEEPSENALLRFIQECQESCYQLELSRAHLTKKVFQALNFVPFVQFSASGPELDGNWISGLPWSFPHLKSFSLSSAEIDMSEVIQLLKRLPPQMEHIGFRSIWMSFADADRFISALPKGLRRLSIGGNEVGAAGIEKFRQYKKRVEEQTGLPFDLLID